jgi:hypothetical protein
MNAILAIWMTAISLFQVESQEIPQEAKKAIDKYKASAESAKKAYDAAVLRAREQVTKDLKTLIQSETAKGNIDVAFAVKSKLGEIQNEDTVQAPPRSESPVPSNNLALNKAVTASGSAKGDGVTPPSRPENAVDGNNGTSWATNHKDKEWVIVDLGKPETVSRVEIAWEAAYAAEYTIEASLNGKIWAEVARKADGQGGLDVLKFPPTKARWIRWNGIKRYKTEWPYNMWEFRVFGN